MAAGARPDHPDVEIGRRLAVRGRRQRAVAACPRYRRSPDHAASVGACQIAVVSMAFEGNVCRQLDQPYPAQAGMATLADDDVIMHGNPQRLGEVDDRFRHLDVGLRGQGETKPCAEGWRKGDDGLRLALMLTTISTRQRTTINHRESQKPVL